MNKLIKLQLRNVFHNKLFYVCLGLTLLMVPILTFIGSLNGADVKNLKVFPQILSFLSSEVGLVSIIFIALFCCFDFTEGTTKNIIARGYTKTELLLSKCFVSLIGIFAIYIITSLVTSILFIKNGMGYESNMLYLLINNILRIVAYTCFYSIMSVVLEKNGSAIIACLFVPTLVPTVLNLIDSKLNLSISKLWIENVSSKFILSPTLENLVVSSLFYVIYIVLFIIIGTQLLKKKEIK